MKVLSLLQPWASLVVTMEPEHLTKALKEYETRSWRTMFRGTLLIHASKKYSHNQEALLDEWPFNEARKLMEPIPTGCIIGAVELVEVLATGSIRDTLSERELEFGDYSDGRFAWKFKKPMKFINPYQCKGALGLWDIDAAIIFNSSNGFAISVKS